MQALQSPTSQPANLPYAGDQAILSREHTVLSAYTVENEIVCPGIHTEVRQVHWDIPPDTAIRTTRGHLYMTLSQNSHESLQLVSADYGRITAGNCIFLPPDHEFRVETSASTVDSRHMCCTFDLSVIQPYIEPDLRSLELAACMNIQNARIRHGMTVLAEEIMAPGFASEILIETTVTALIIELARHSRDVRVAQEVGSKLSARQLRLVEDRVMGSVSLPPSTQELAAECGLSHRHFTRTFKNTTGRTLGEYIAEVRVNQAKQLLASSDALIKTVAYTCGFQSQEAFAKAFRKATGWSPQQFRKVSA